MRGIDVVLDPNETGIACDLRFTARTACVEEGRQIARRGTGAVYMDATRFAQYGRWQGEIEYDGKKLAIDSDARLRHEGPFVGDSPGRRARDRRRAGRRSFRSSSSCGRRSTGRTAARTSAIFDEADGRTWHFDGAVMPGLRLARATSPAVEDPGTRKMVDGKHTIVYVPGTRRAKSALISMADRSGERMEISLEPLLCFQMKGHRLHAPAVGPRLLEGRAGDRRRMLEVLGRRSSRVREPARPAGHARAHGRRDRDRGARAVLHRAVRALWIRGNDRRREVGRRSETLRVFGQERGVSCVIGPRSRRCRIRAPRPRPRRSPCPPRLLHRCSSR